MNKIALRNFAIESRRELISKIKIKAEQIGITEKDIKEETLESSDAVFVEGVQLSIEEQFQRNKLIDEIKTKGYGQIIEEVAYTWFNRFTALRFMEVNNYLPTKIRVLSSKDEGSYEPDIIKEALNIKLDVDKEFVYNLRTSNENDAIDKLYKYLIIKQCDSLSDILPFLFGKTDDFTKLLFPDGLLQSSFLKDLTDLNNISEEDWEKVEILGWLYQYYIAEENERVIRAKKKYKKEEIPFATQLFTPDWIVRYMVQNTLGRYWVESHPEDRGLIEKWEFYLENPNPDIDFKEKLSPYLNKDMKVEDIKCFDPAMGSGHILVYIFDVLFQIYSRCGYMEREIPKLIIENNLYGLEIDDRAYQLACFAVIMKAQQYNSRFLRSLQSQIRNTGEYIKLNLASIQETNDFTTEDIEYLAGETEGENFEKTKAFIEQFKNAKIYGSLTEIKEFDEAFLNKRVGEILNNPVENLVYQQSKDKVDNIILDLIKQTKIIKRIYDVLVTNPPYIGNRYLNPLLGDFLEDKYSDVKSDIFAAFIVYSFNKTVEKGQLGFMTPYVWMFISSYEKLREKIITGKNISSLVQLEYSGFDGATVPICTFTLRNMNNRLPGEYIKLSDFKGVENQPIKTMEAVVNPNVDYRYTSKMDNFSKIPGSPIAYWTSDNFVDIFQYETLGDFANIITGMTTGNNNLYLRFWTEVDINKVNFYESDINEIDLNLKYWIPYNKGGPRRNWYGNNEYLVNWSQRNNFNRAKTTLKHLYLRKGITWPFVTSGDFSARYFDYGFLWDVAGSPCFFDDDNILYYCLGFMCTKLSNMILKIINPTINVQAVDLEKLPLKYSYEDESTIIDIVRDSIRISKTDWDSFETSWDFQRHPFLQFINHNSQCTIEEVFKQWEDFTNKQFEQLKYNEEELNRIFIKIYGLQDKLTPEIAEEDITLSKADRERDIKSFISYAVGCMFGRYSLDKEGLVFAGGEFDSNKYKTLSVDEDNIIPILSDAYFENDIVNRFVDFVRIIFGEDTLNENLKYIAETLGIRTNETSKDTIRRYFINNFYKDHVKTYKKRPIYWLFTSGKQKAFNALIYMHRYDSATLARVRTDYLHVLQSRFDIERDLLLENIKDNNISAAEKRRYEKELKDLDKRIDELKEYDEVLHHMADKMIEIDLDDGVKLNYVKFKGIVQKI